MALIPKNILDLIEQSKRLGEITAINNLSQSLAMYQNGIGSKIFSGISKTEMTLGLVLKQQSLFSQDEAALLKGANFLAGWKESIGAATTITNQMAGITKAIGMAKAKTSLLDYQDLLGASRTFFESNIALTKAIDSLAKTNSVLKARTHIQGFQQAIEMAGLKFAASSFLKNNPIDLKQFSVIAKQLATVAVDISETNHASTEELLKIAESLNESFNRRFDELKVEFKRSQKTPAAYIAFYATLFGFLISLFQLIQTIYIKAGDKPATVSQVAKIQQALVDRFDSAMNGLAGTGKIGIACPIRLKPSGRSQVLAGLKPGASIKILGQFHKWMNVSFIDPEDNLPVSGWVLKKHIIKTKMKRN